MRLSVWQRGSIQKGAVARSKKYSCWLDQQRQFFDCCLLDTLNRLWACLTQRPLVFMPYRKVHRALPVTIFVQACCRWSTYWYQRCSTAPPPMKDSATPERCVRACFYQLEADLCRPPQHNIKQLLNTCRWVSYLNSCGYLPKDPETKFYHTLQLNSDIDITN